MLPDSLETFVYKGLNKLDNLPASLKHLKILRYSYQCDLNCLPENLETLTIHHVYKKEIKNKPKNLQIIYLYINI